VDLYSARSLLLGAASFGIIVCSSPRDAAAFELKHSRDGARVHWDANRVAFTLHASVDELDGGDRAIHDAFAAWSGRAGAPELAIEGGQAPASPGLDGKNAVFYVKGGYAPAGRALAITVLTYDAKTGAIVDADIVVNGAYRFAVLPATAHGGPTPTAVSNDADGHELPFAGAVDQYDLLHVLAHESGHALGLDDENTLRQSLMYRYSSPNDASVRAPTTDDIDGLSEVYGDKMSASGGGCAAAPSRSLGWGAVLVGGAIAVLALRRRRRGSAIFGATAIGLGLFCASETPSARADVDARRLGDATARVASVETKNEGGLFRTTLDLEITDCRAAACPPRARFVTWGGEIDGLRQQVGNYHVPTRLETVELSFERTAVRAIAPSRGAGAERTPGPALRQIAPEE
jgi:hypothetical protein